MTRKSSQPGARANCVLWQHRRCSPLTRQLDNRRSHRSHLIGSAESGIGRGDGDSHTTGEPWADVSQRLRRQTQRCESHVSARYAGGTLSLSAESGSSPWNGSGLNGHFPCRVRVNNIMPAGYSRVCSMSLDGDYTQHLLHHPVLLQRSDRLSTSFSPTFHALSTSTLLYQDGCTHRY